MIDLSIVIINWNGQQVLRPCLTSLFEANQGIEYEVIVVDNGSQDDSPGMLRREFPQVKMIENTTNAGFATANNQAFVLARGRYVLLLNNDTVVLHGALANSVRYMDAHPTVGAMGCRIEFPDRSFQTSCYRFTNLLELIMVKLLPLGSIARERLNLARYWGREFTKPTLVDVIAGCFMVVRREVFASAGKLDQEFFMYGEDEEWCSRIKRAGWQIVYYPGATIIHLHRFSSRHAHRAISTRERLSPVLVLHKRRGYLIAWVANLLLFIGSVIRFPIWIILDGYHMLRGTAEQGLLYSRFTAIGIHLKGMVRPVWLPRASQ